MRLRNIPGAKDAIAESIYVIQNPQENKGNWDKVFPQNQPVHLEVGMGKVEQAAVVSFELDGYVFFQNLVVAGKKFPGGKAAGSVAGLWPGIGKIQIDF